MLLRTYLYNILRNRKRLYRILSLLLVASGLLWVNQIVTTKSPPPPGIYSHTTKVYSEWDVFEAPTLLKQIREHLTMPVDRSVPYNLTANGNETYPEHDKMHSALLQVLFNETGGNQTGFFVEAGALDGQYLSHTLELEQSHGWTGLLVEGSPSLVPQLKSKNRKSWIADVCLTEKVFLNATYITRQKQEVNWKRGNGQIAPAGGQKFGFQSEGSVECYSLYSILKAAEAPNVVDLLVLDIEGGELEILKGYPFHLLPIKVIAVEYWITPGGSSALLKLLKENGYQLKYTGISDMIFVLE